MLGFHSGRNGSLPEPHILYANIFSFRDQFLWVMYLHRKEPSSSALFVSVLCKWSANWPLLGLGSWKKKPSSVPPWSAVVISELPEKWTAGKLTCLLFPVSPMGPWEKRNFLGDKSTPVMRRWFPRRRRLGCPAVSLQVLRSGGGQSAGCDAIPSGMGIWGPFTRGLYIRRSISLVNRRNRHLKCSYV